MFHQKFYKLFSCILRKLMYFFDVLLLSQLGTMLEKLPKARRTIQGWKNSYKCSWNYKVVVFTKADADYSIFQSPLLPCNWYQTCLLSLFIPYLSLIVAYFTWLFLFCPCLPTFFYLLALKRERKKLDPLDLRRRKNVS